MFPHEIDLYFFYSWKDAVMAWVLQERVTPREDRERERRERGGTEREEGAREREREIPREVGGRRRRLSSSSSLDSRIPEPETELAKFAGRMDNDCACTPHRFLVWLSFLIVGL